MSVPDKSVRSLHQRGMVRMNYMSLPGRFEDGKRPDNKSVQSGIRESTVVLLNTKSWCFENCIHQYEPK